MEQFGQFRGGQARGWYTMLLGAARLAKGDVTEARVQTLAAVEILKFARNINAVSAGPSAPSAASPSTAALSERPKPACARPS